VIILDPAALIGADVQYDTPGQPPELGVVMSVRDGWVFVQFDGRPGALATPPGRLTVIDPREHTCGLCHMPAVVVDGGWKHAEAADEAFCQLVMRGHG
jgi:hypothetical protein